MSQRDSSDVEGLRLSLARLRHGLGNSLMLLDARLTYLEVTAATYYQTLRHVQSMLHDCLDPEEEERP